MPFPFADLTGVKIRPAVIVSNASVNKTSEVICVQVTSQPFKDGFTFEIKDSDVVSVLRGYSEIRCHKLFTADKSIIHKKISKLHASKQAELMKRILALL